MKEKTLNYIIYTCLAITSIAALIVGITIFVKSEILDTTLAAGFLGFIGAIIGGLITLVGVKRTIQENRKINNQEKYLIANYIFIELLPELTQMNNKIKSITQLNLSTDIVEIKEQSVSLKNTAKFMKEESKKIDLFIHREVKNIEYNAINIIEFINSTEENPDITDREIYEQLMYYRNELAKSDQELFEIVNRIKHS